MSRATIVDLPPEEEEADTLESGADEIQQLEEEAGPVSYTHLPLPPIYSV